MSTAVLSWGRGWFGSFYVLRIPTHIRTTLLLGTGSILKRDQCCLLKNLLPRSLSLKGTREQSQIPSRIRWARRNLLSTVHALSMTKGVIRLMMTMIATKCNERSRFPHFTERSREALQKCLNLRLRKWTRMTTTTSKLRRKNCSTAHSKKLKKRPIDD